MDIFFLHSAQGSFSWSRVDLAWLLRRAYSRPFGLHPSSLSKSAGFVFQSGKASLVSISAAILYYDPGMFIFCWSSNSWKKLCWMRAWRWRWHLLSPTLYIIIVYRVNLNKLSQNFVGATRTTTTDYRVSFIDLYLVFPTNFRIVFLPHTNNVILLEPYSGTITEPGLPVQRLRELFHDNYVQISMRNVAYGVCRQLFICLQKFRQITA